MPKAITAPPPDLKAHSLTRSLTHFLTYPHAAGVQRGPVPLSAGPRTRSLAPEAASLFRGPHEASPASRMQHEASPLSVARLGAALRSAADLPHILQSSTPAASALCV